MIAVRIDRTRIAAVGATLIACAWLASPASAQLFNDQSLTRLPDANEYSSQCSVADIDGDGDIDIAFANGRGFASASLQEQVRLMINDGSGFFTDESVARLGALVGYGRDVQFGDVDGDGDLDMVVANDFNTQQRLLINDGTGNFADESVARLGSFLISSSHVAFGDVDDDGDLDLWFTRGGASRFGSGQPQLLINDGTGNFTNESTARIPAILLSEPMDCSFGDLDGDFDLDLVAANRSSNTSRVYFNDGTGNFMTTTLLPPNANTYSFDLGDLDADGDLDIFGANTLSGSSREAIFINDGAGGFTDQTSTWIPGTNNQPNDDNDSKFIDYDGDGDLDVIIAALGGGSERILRNNGSSYQLMSGLITAVNDSSLDVEVADFDGDGDYDLVTAQGESGGFRNRIYMNVGPFSDTIAPTFPQLLQVDDTADTAGPYVVRAVIRDAHTSDTGAFYTQLLLRYSVDGGPTTNLPLTWIGQDMYRGEIPGVAGGVVSYSVRATDFAGNTGESAVLSFEVSSPEPQFRRGDCNQDAQFNVADPVSTLSTLFAGGDPFACDDACDVNDDGNLDISDPISSLAALFQGGSPPAPPGPGPDCGSDPTADTLECAAEPVCP